MASSKAGSPTRTTERLFRDRRAAGRALAALLEHCRGREDARAHCGFGRGEVPETFPYAV